MRGRSQIIDFTGRVMNLAETTGEVIVQADIELERLRQKRSQMQMNFLAQVQTEVHARQYARKTMWPARMWADAPPPGDLGNIKVGREIIKRLLDDGTLTPPGTAMDKDSYV
jgi:hypothetical protein